MKRLTLTPQIESHMRRALGADADLSQYAIFEATALNTLPLRKNHPLFKGAVTDTSILHEMAATILTESVPVQIQHDKEPLPVGRVFHGEVVPNGSTTELRALFWITATETDVIGKVDNGTVDQVSVSILAKQALNSVSGFDYMGPDATFENMMTGDDGKGNILNQNGVHAILKGLDSFFEMSLVGKGGATNARIHRRDQTHFGSSYEQLAASGIDPNAFTLVASAEEPEMDLKPLLDRLEAQTAQLTELTAERDQLQTQVTELTAKETELSGQVATLTAAAANADEVLEQKTELDAAKVSLASVTTLLLTANGETDVEVPAKVADMVSMIEAKKTSLAAAIIAGGHSRAADHDLTVDLAEEAHADRRAQFQSMSNRRT